jgi:Lar family restriction alleviation protein
MTDLIYRDDALALVEQWFATDNHLYSIILNDITNLPALDLAALTPNPVDDSQTANPVVNDPAAIRNAALLPCPFCGGKKNTICRTDYDGRDAYAVSCRYPECHGAIFTLGYGYFADKEEAIAAWNTRALPAIDPAAIREAALREAAEVADKLAVEWWLTYKNTIPHYQGMSDGADEVSNAILALIGEKK